MSDQMRLLGRGKPGGCSGRGSCCKSFCTRNLRNKPINLIYGESLYNQVGGSIANMKSIPLLVLLVVWTLSSGCVSPSVKGPNSPDARYTHTEPERTLHMTVYLRALSEGKIQSGRKPCYLAEDEQFIKELNQKAGTGCFRQINRMLLNRMLAGICQEPGQYISIRFSKVTEHYAEARLSCELPAREHVCGGVRYDCWMEERGGEWTIHWTTIFTAEASNHRAALDAGSAFCYESGVRGPARVGAGRSAS